ncbi:MAG: peptide chain release factor 2 [Candidatus Moranbacteria bacterium CG_4_10_14_3_um_filter_45_9]|nr:MAG: peptide chain release factor 2 [Candidatus Moranbacteria bacterium CG_4_10_14_3_um_filter_45_9]
MFDSGKKAVRIKDLRAESEQPGFWNDPKTAGQSMRELEALQNEQISFQNLEKRVFDLEGLADLEDLQPEDAIELEKEYAEIEKTFGEWELKTLLGGEYDAGNALLTVRSGAGGVDAQDWAEMLLRIYVNYAEKQEWKTRLLDESRGTEAGIKSATIEIVGSYAYGYLHGEAGIHRLVRLSPFNANSLRQTSFASIEVMPIIDDKEMIPLKPDELRIDTYRSSGAGGQNVNKTESAVRVTHIPTGLVVACQSERSQLQNKEEAMKMLRSKMAQKHIEEQAEAKRKLRGDFKSAAWGNQIRSYVIHPYTLVKDHRTGTETSDTGKVLGGDLQTFIESELRYLQSH